MKVLYISNLFPDNVEFSRGLFNARFVRHFSKLCDVKVLSPRPSFLFWKSYTPCPEDANLSPIYQTVPYIPLWGTPWNHRLMFFCLKSKVRRIQAGFEFDIILASWLFPDGCAACRLGKTFNVPVAVTALGTDIHQYAFFPLRRKIILKELQNASAVITVSQSLAKILEDSGFDSKRLHVIYYGVDQHIFKPANKIKVRQSLGLPTNDKIVLFVGNFLPIKDPLLTLDSFYLLTRNNAVKNVLLILVGGGPLENKIKRRAKSYGISDRLVFVGKKRPEDTSKYMQAADVLCLTSHNEGVPNVVLEALSCGTPVVTTKVGGIPEVLPEFLPSIMVDSRSPETIANALIRIMDTKFDPNILVTHASKYSWDQTAREYHDLLLRILDPK